jgi:hypothetical protein
MSRQQTGKTSIATIFVRMATVLSVPVWLLVLLCALGGVWVVIVPILVGWYGAIAIKSVFEYLFIHAYVNARFGNDPDYQQWKQAGGDVYFDAQGFPYNFDSLPAKLATTLAHPPDGSCPRCGGGWTKWGGKQCGVCYTYWDEGTQMYMYWEPDPRFTSAAVPTADPHDPAVLRGRTP